MALGYPIIRYGGDLPIVPDFSFSVCLFVFWFFSTTDHMAAAWACATADTVEYITLSVALQSSLCVSPSPRCSLDTGATDVKITGFC